MQLRKIDLYITIFEVLQDSFLFLKKFKRCVKNNPITAGTAILKIQSNELAEKTITPNELLISFISIHFSKITILTEPLTAISVIVINGIIIIDKYVNEIGIIA